MARPGEWILSDQPIEINVGRRTCKLKVRNTGDRPIQIGSHFHFFEVNRALDFERALAMGMHLNLPGGLATRFEPGDEKEVELVEYGGNKRVVGFNNLVNGGLNSQWTVKQAMERARDLGFKGSENANHDAASNGQPHGAEKQGGSQPAQDKKGRKKQGSKS